MCMNLNVLSPYTHVHLPHLVLCIHCFYRPLYIHVLNILQIVAINYGAEGTCYLQKYVSCVCQYILLLLAYFTDRSHVHFPHLLSYTPVKLHHSLSTFRSCSLTPTRVQNAPARSISAQKRSYPVYKRERRTCRTAVRKFLRTNHNQPTFQQAICSDRTQEHNEMLPRIIARVRVNGKGKG